MLKGIPERIRGLFAANKAARHEHPALLSHPTFRRLDRQIQAAQPKVKASFYRTFLRQGIGPIAAEALADAAARRWAKRERKAAGLTGRYIPH